MANIEAGENDDDDGGDNHWQGHERKTIYG